jgi:thiosulfate/3-mercaptopyruvate sulfurtransferase
MKFTTLVSTEQLAEHLTDPDWVVFDCRFTLTDPEAGRRAYANGHIPGARYAHLDQDLSSPVTEKTGRHPLPDADALAEKLSAWGVGPNTQVVVYDDSFGAMAVRLWWLLRWLGHEAVALLDGGYPKWNKEKRPLTDALPDIRPAAFHAVPHRALWADAAQVDAARQDAQWKVLDARPEMRFTGDVEPLDPVAGHIPGTFNWPFEENLDLGGTYLPAEELREAYLRILDGVPPNRVIHSCGSGVTACHNVLAMERAGLAGSVLYAGSWSEWITDPARPVETGEQGLLCE